jgi:hypothetical protein
MKIATAILLEKLNFLRILFDGDILKKKCRPYKSIIEIPTRYRAHLNKFRHTWPCFWIWLIHTTTLSKQRLSLSCMTECISKYGYRWNVSW